MLVSSSLVACDQRAALTDPAVVTVKPDAAPATTIRDAEQPDVNVDANPPFITDGPGGCVPDPLPQGPFTFVASGNGFSCAIRSDGSVVCWGRRADAPVGAFSRL